MSASSARARVSGVSGIDGSSLGVGAGGSGALWTAEDAAADWDGWAAGPLSGPRAAHPDKKKSAASAASSDRFMISLLIWPGRAASAGTASRAADRQARR